VEAVDATPDESPFDVTVVISSRNRREMLRGAVESVLEARRVPSELVIIDQSENPDPSLERGNVRGCEVRYVHSPTRGVSRGRNLGLRLASNDLVVLVDDDMLVLDDSLERLLAAHDGGTKTITGGQVLSGPPERPGVFQPLIAIVRMPEFEIFRGRQPGQVVFGANVALSRSVVLEVGGYDERLGPGTRFPAAEDTDLSYRLLDAGCEVRHLPDAVMLHRAWRAQGERIRLRWNYGRGQGAVYAKHASFRDPFVLGIGATDFGRRFLWATQATFRGEVKEAIAQLVSIAGLFCGVVQWFVRYRIYRGPSPRPDPSAPEHDRPRTT
jgi:GT2 family glycosyltransferase